MGNRLIDELSALNGERKGRRGDAWMGAQPLLRIGTHLRVLEQRLAKSQRREAFRAKRVRDWERKAAGRAGKDRWRVPRGRSFRGTVSVETQWVRLLARMEPGRWYGMAVLDRMAGGMVGYLWVRALFLEKANNPRFDPAMHSAGTWGPKARYRGEYIEPRYLWRLNRWGESLRAAVLDDPTAERIDVTKLTGARPDQWFGREKPRGGRVGVIPKPTKWLRKKA